MAEDKIEEETYSLILSVLKHPLRRKILRMLADKPLSFSEILESVAIDSGHLNYHIKNMGDIVTHTEDGKYALSSVGYAAIELVGKVEEQDKSNKTIKRTRRISRLALVFSVIFAVCLLTVSIHALTYTTQNERVLFSTPTNSVYPKLVNLQPGDQYKYSISLNTLSLNTLKFVKEYAPIYSVVGQYKTVVEVPPPNNSITRWTRYFSKTALWLAPNDTTVKLYVTVYSPNDKITLQYRIDTLYTGPSNSLQSFEFIDFGTYTLQFENLGDDPVAAVLIPSGSYKIYEKPLFNYGIAGFIILLLYPVLFFLSWNWKQKTAGQTDKPKLAFTQLF